MTQPPATDDGLKEAYPARDALCDALQNDRAERLAGNWGLHTQHVAFVATHAHSLDE
eukprot:m.198726 g.198726  ORF g.198726 m.198726 type:complete len:57 (+) comp53793_c0_seq7:734-904(+)